MHFTLFFLILRKYVVDIYDNVYIVNALIMLTLIFSFIYFAWKSTYVPVKTSLVCIELPVIDNIANATPSTSPPDGDNVTHTVPDETPHIQTQSGVNDSTRLSSSQQTILTEHHTSPDTHLHHEEAVAHLHSHLHSHLQHHHFHHHHHHDERGDSHHHHHHHHNAPPTHHSHGFPPHHAHQHAPHHAPHHAAPTPNSGPQYVAAHVTIDRREQTQSFQRVTIALTLRLIRSTSELDVFSTPTSTPTVEFMDGNKLYFELKYDPATGISTRLLPESASLNLIEDGLPEIDMDPIT